jgi:23S rRNA (adenine2030-N6)-methyltransferase
MLSYRHAFHAGNHADVLKHTVLIQLLHYFGQKDASYFYIDTHAGAGLYALHGEQATKNAEFETGLSRLWEKKDLPAPLADYVKLIKKLNPDGKMRYYPGSPFIAEKILREQDRLRLFELHPNESKILQQNFKKQEAHEAAQGRKPSARGSRVIVEMADGFDALKSLLPPPSRRALVLLDPPYEDKLDYRRVISTLNDALSRFSTGTYAIWYPILHRMEAREFPARLKRLPAQDWLNVSLTVAKPAPDGIGLTGSGMFILNPPWTLAATLQDVMPYLVSALGQDSDARFTLESSAK